MTTEFDYIIIGSGAAGSSLAYRLSQSGRHRVLVLEYGPEDSDPLHRIPKGYLSTAVDDRYTYRYPTDDGTKLDARTAGSFQRKYGA